MSNRLMLLTAIVLPALLATSSPRETTRTSSNSLARNAAAKDPPLLANISKVPKTVEVNLTAGVATLSLTPAITTEVFAYNGHVPGPPLNVLEADHLSIPVR